MDEKKVTRQIADNIFLELTEKKFTIKKGASEESWCLNDVIFKSIISSMMFRHSFQKMKKEFYEKFGIKI